MIEKIWEYLKHSVTVAWKSVIFNFKQYACFFLAILMIEVLYGMVAVSTENGNAAQYRRIGDEYDYHVVLSGLSDDQARYIIAYGDSPFRSDQFYEIRTLESYISPVTGQIYHELFLRFTDQFSPEDAYARLERTYLSKVRMFSDESEIFTVHKSPLMRLAQIKSENTVTYTAVSAFLLILCIFLLTSLYRIRMNHYRFEYGIYLTFGADFKMLYSTAFWELFMIFILTFVPAVLLSALFSYLVYSGGVYGFVFSAGVIWKMLVFSLITILVSVWTPVRLLSIKEPMSLIISEDNSNLVTSPRTSLSIFGEKFPTRYEFYSMWRFRKYNIRVLTTAIVFCAMFIIGLYSAEIYKSDQAKSGAQFTVSLPVGYSFNKEISDELYAIDGVKKVTAGFTPVDPLSIASHVLINNSDVGTVNSLPVYDGDGFDTKGEKYKVSNSFTYSPMAEERLSELSEYNYSGDLSCINDDGYVIIGDAHNNMKAYNFEVGDKIAVAVKTGQMRPIDSNETGKNLLKSQVRYFRFEYVEFTVGAVLHDIPCDETPIYFSLGSFEKITGQSAQSKSVYIYADGDMTFAESDTLYTDIRKWAHSMGNSVVTDTDELLNATAADDKSYGKLLLVISVMLLIISPIVWFFSQSLYYSKREKEFNILRSLGAVSKDIMRICLQGGLSMAALSLIMSLALSYAGSYLMYLFANVVIPKITSASVRYAYYMPWYAVVISVAVSAACGFLSTYLPYRSYIRRRASLQNGGAGAEPDGE